HGMAGRAMSHDAAIEVAEARRSWEPMAIIAMGQVLMSFNGSALPVSIGGIVVEFGAPPTAVGTAIVANLLTTARFTMVAAKLGQKFGSLSVFRAGTGLLCAAMLMMTLSSGVVSMIIAQGVAGIASAALVPALVVLIVDNYSGGQRAKALGVLGAVQAIS